MPKTLQPSKTGWWWWWGWGWWGGISDNYYEDAEADGDEEDDGDWGGGDNDHDDHENFDEEEADGDWGGGTDDSIWTKVWSPWWLERGLPHGSLGKGPDFFIYFFSFEKIQIKYHLLVNIFINLNTALTMLMLMLTMTIMLLKAWEDFREVQWDRSTCIRPGTN